MYNAVFKPVWTYGLQLFGTASKSNIAVMERFQNKVLRAITNAPWFISNKAVSYTHLDVYKRQTGYTPMELEEDIYK